jgi:hypothetical protein
MSKRSNFWCLTPLPHFVFSAKGASMSEQPTFEELMSGEMFTAADWSREKFAAAADTTGRLCTRSPRL